MKKSVTLLFLALLLTGCAAHPIRVAPAAPAQPSTPPDPASKAIWRGNYVAGPPDDPWDTAKTSELKQMVTQHFPAWRLHVAARGSGVSVLIAEPNKNQAYRDMTLLCQLIFAKYPFVTGVNFNVEPEGADGGIEVDFPRANISKLHDPSQFPQLASRYEVLGNTPGDWLP